MKIIFYSTDKSVEKFFSSIEVDDSFLCTSLDELETHLSDEKQSVIFLDFDCDELECSSLSNELASIETINTVLISKKMSLKEILDFQNSEDACDAYLAKPLAVEVLNGVINDFEIALSSADDSGESVDSGSSNIDLTFVGIKKDLLDQLDSMEVEEENSEEDEEIDFKASTLQVASEVRDVIDSHKSNGTNFENVVNDEIQRKFDAVFDRVNHSDQESVKEEFNITPQGFDSGEVDKKDDDGISFDLGGEDSTQDDVRKEENNEVAESAKDPLVEVKMSDDKEEDVGLEFNIPDSDSPSDDSVNLAEDQSDDLSFSEDEDEAEGGLEFNLGSDEETATDITDGSSPDDLDFSEETSGGLDLSANEEGFNAVDTTVEEDTGLSFDDEDSSDDLLIGGEEDSSSSSSIDEEDGLSFDDDEDEGLNLNESYETESESVEVSSNDDLDFSAKEEDSGVDFGDIEATDPSYETGMGADTSSDIESTISSIVAPATSDENSTGEFDLSNIANDAIEDEEEEMQEFDYKTSSGFSASALIEDDDFGEIDDSLGEDTNPTIVASTSTLTTSDFMAQSGEDSSDDSFDEEEELSFGDETGTNEIESNLSPDNTGETVVADMLKNEVEEVSYAETNTPKVENIARSYDEDEMLRLQGTIRQLREERESLMNSINSLTSEKQLLSQDNLGLKAELDEVKIELEIVKKRSHDEVSEMKYQMNLSHEKKDVYEMKYKSLYKEFDRLNQKVRIDFNQVKQREKELESKLELVVMDSDSQVQTRDMKILELKRKIDSLEFNMENSSIREQKHREDKSKLEERLAKIMKTLRGSIQLIEDDLEVLETDNTTDLDKN